MIQQLSAAELEVMKIIWGDAQEGTLFPYIMEALAARGSPVRRTP